MPRDMRGRVLGEDGEPIRNPNLPFGVTDPQDRNNISDFFKTLNETVDLLENLIEINDINRMRSRRGLRLHAKSIGVDPEDIDKAVDSERPMENLRRLIDTFNEEQRSKLQQPKTRRRGESSDAATLQQDIQEPDEGEDEDGEEY